LQYYALHRDELFAQTVTTTSSGKEKK